MSTPNADLISALVGSDGLSGVSVHGVRSQVSPPAVVVRPDEPWREPDRFCADLQHYVAVATVQAASAEEGVDRLTEITTAIIDSLPEGWDFDSVGSPIIDESTGTSFLVAPVRLSYRNGA